MLRKHAILALIAVTCFFTPLWAGTNTGTDAELQVLIDGKNQVRQLIHALSNASETLLAMTLETEDPTARIAALTVIKGRDSISDERLINLIVKNLYYGIIDNSGSTDTSAYNVRKAAIEAAVATKGGGNPQVVVRELGQLLRTEEDYLLRVKLVYAIGEFGSEGVGGLPRIKEILRLSKREAIVHESVVAVGKIGDSSVIPTLIAISQDHRFSSKTRMLALEVIGKLSKQ